MIRVYQVLNKLSDKEIMKRLGEKYPEQKESLDGYQDVLNDLRSLEPTDLTGSPVIRCKKFGCHIVLGGDDMSYGFGPIAWEEVLGSYAHRGGIEFICSLLWELTFYGFTQKENVSFWDDIKDRVKGLD